MTTPISPRLPDRLPDQARPLEQALWQGLGRDKPQAGETIARELARFQNPDGGFGHGLEPDYRSPRSSVLATNRALGLVFRCRGLAADWPSLTVPAVRWLRQACDQAAGVWPIIGPDGEADPHAPWWTFDKTPQEFGSFRLNPTAETLSWLLYFGEEDDRAFAAARVPRVLEAWRDPAAATVEGALDAVKHWVEVPGMVPEARAEVEKTLADRIAAKVETDPLKWSSYCWKPFQACPRPDSPGADRLGPAVRANLEWQLSRLGPDTSVAPHWSWFGAFPEAWPQAEADWRGVLTLDVLLACRAWGLFSA